MENKEVIEKLVEYFVTQDIKTIAHCLAAIMVDCNRLVNQEKLSLSQRKNLWNRIHLNNKSLSEFLEKGPQGDLKCKILNSE